MPAAFFSIRLCFVSLLLRFLDSLFRIGLSAFDFDLIGPG